MKNRKLVEKRIAEYHDWIKEITDIADRADKIINDYNFVHGDFYKLRQERCDEIFLMSGLSYREINIYKKQSKYSSYAASEVYDILPKYSFREYHKKDGTIEDYDLISFRQRVYGTLENILRYTEDYNLRVFHLNTELSPIYIHIPSKFEFKYYLESPIGTLIKKLIIKGCYNDANEFCLNYIHFNK